MRADPGAFGNANPGGMKPAVCNSFLSSACAANSAMTTSVNIFTFTRNPSAGKCETDRCILSPVDLLRACRLPETISDPTPFPLENAEQDVAMFQLSRGPYAYLVRETLEAAVLSPPLRGQAEKRSSDLSAPL